VVRPSDARGLTERLGVGAWLDGWSGIDWHPSSGVKCLYSTSPGNGFLVEMDGTPGFNEA
jgi:hypothetical protein